MTEYTAYIAREIKESISVKVELGTTATEQIAEAASAIVTCLRAGGKLIVFGNGGSASDAQHMVAELVGRYAVNRQALAAIALTTNSSSLTAIANDFGFEEIFARQLEAFGKPDDVVLAISTSGNSPNVLRGLEAAKALSLKKIGLTGNASGNLRNLVDICVTVPSSSTPRIQEAHTLVIHILCGIVENAFVHDAYFGGQILIGGKAR
ncbi:MAG TPA: D-sedoheptulose 7-phosphate isomerase [Candidatus Acidoferrum sp.]|jgi:D-sedoheptulose 7-phosphate isomerase|nr:D-sedoheptulose 7-phosphate isomerase [Candidatus Acidoferrum sp.]